MEFSPTHLFIVPSSNSLPTTGSTNVLTANQFGIYKDDFQAATAGNVTTAKYIYPAQGWPQAYPGTGTKNLLSSAVIYPEKVVDFYKIEAEPDMLVQITDISDFSAVCSETVTITLRLFSFYARTAVSNGFTRSFTVQTPCCECGDNPCDQVDVEALVDEFVAQINGNTMGNLNVAEFVTAERIGSGDTSTLRIIGKLITPDAASCDPNVNPYIFDTLSFFAYAYKGPATTQDFNIYSLCDPFATVDYVQSATYPTGTTEQVLQMEKDYWTYSVPPIAKPLFDNVNFNHGYTSQVEDVNYDLYYIKYKSPSYEGWNPHVPEDITTIIAIPAGEGTTIEAILVAALGAITDESPESITTTTTTSTSTTTSTTSSTTTTTTTL